ncbi:hypothetical protein [Streptomyces sp. NPDC001714]|uniref:hypothetical protein n=1 Tax=Streptomyces sp. NPDC001714 TaxID=3364603 RepID=UPI0036C11B41
MSVPEAIEVIRPSFFPSGAGRTVLLAQLANGPVSTSGRSGSLHVPDVEVTSTALADYSASAQTAGPHLPPVLVDGFQRLSRRQTHSKWQVVERGAQVRDGAPGVLLRGADPVGGKRERR